VGGLQEGDQTVEECRLVSGTIGRSIGAIALSLVLLGCSHQEFSRPTLRSPAAVVGDLLDSGKPYVEPGKSKTQMRMERLAEALAAWQTEPGHQAGDYLIGPSDVLDVDVFALEVPGETTTLRRTVFQDGYITLPWVGGLSAAGLTARELEGTIARAYAGRYIKDPQVTVTIAEYRSAPVVVTGAVAKPGVYYLTSGSGTVLALLAQAGGLSEEAGDELLVIRAGNSGPLAGTPGHTSGGGSSSDVVELLVPEPSAQASGGDSPALSPSDRTAVVIDLKQLVDEGNLVLNLGIRSGDIVTVPRRLPEYVYVLGYVQRPGAYELKDRERVDALRAVALAGGLVPSARAENSFLVRETAKGQMVVPVDLTKLARGARPPLYVQPGDTLVVGSSTIAKMTEYIRPTVGAGAHYSVGQ
jgi:polysaccharide export outer membrane protein